MEPEVKVTKSLADQIQQVVDNGKTDESVKKELMKYKDSESIPFRLVKEVHDALSKIAERKLYLHEMLHGSDLYIPEFQLPPRDPELEARCQKLRAEQENKRYKEMVRNIDKKQKDQFSLGNDVKEMNRQLISVFNFLVTVGGAFAFGYKATEYTFNGFSNVFALQLIAGLTLATVVFFADLYFMLKES